MSNMLAMVHRLVHVGSLRYLTESILFAGSSKVDRIILLDREVDVVTPMVTQITFEGLIDEITGRSLGV